MSSSDDIDSVCTGFDYCIYCLEDLWSIANLLAEIMYFTVFFEIMYFTVKWPWKVSDST